MEGRALKEATTKPRINVYIKAFNKRLTVI